MTITTKKTNKNSTGYKAFTVCQKLFPTLKQMMIQKQTIFDFKLIQWSFDLLEIFDAPFPFKWSSMDHYRLVWVILFALPQSTMFILVVDSHVSYVMEGKINRYLRKITSIDSSSGANLSYKSWSSKASIVLQYFACFFFKNGSHTCPFLYKIKKIP